MEGKVVQLNSVEGDISDSNLEMFRVEDYITEVALEWLGNEEVQNAFEDNELGQQVLIEGDIGTLFNEIAKQKQAEHPELSDFFSNVDSDFGGTINVDYTYGVFGVGLVATNAEGQTEGIEMYISASSGIIVDFSDDILYSYDEFVELVGFDFIADMNEIESTLTADMFETVTE